MAATGRGRPQSSAASRRARVERSRQQAAGTDSTDEVVDAEIVDDETVDNDESTPTVDSETTESAEALEADVTDRRRDG